MPAPGMAGGKPPERDRRVAGAAAVRLGILGVTGCLGLLEPHAADPGPFALLAIAGFLLTGFEWTLLRRWFGRSGELLGHYVGDVLLLTAAVVWGGGPQAQFAPLYLLVVAAAGASAGLGPGLFCGLLAAVGYPASLWITRSLAGPEGVEWARATVLSLVFLSVGALAGMLSQHADEHRRELEEARRRLHRMQLDTEGIVHNMSSGLLTVDGAGIVGICNRAASDILGLCGSQPSGQVLEHVLSPGLQDFTRVMQAAVSQGRVRQREEVEIRRPDGRVVPLGVSTSLLLESNGERCGAVAIFQDLTEARELARRARRQETLAAIGELAAGVAHEIRNCLNPITGSIELLRGEKSLADESQRLMDLITREGERLNQFIGELLDFARMEELHPRPMEVGMLLEEVSRLLECHPRRGAGHGIECRAEGESGARVDAEQMRRVFVNLGLNALEAMNGSGHLVLRLLEPGEECRTDELGIVFEDDGQGIRPEDLPHVFEPFFTTKRGGTGLGLSLARQVVERHGGRILAESQPGRGTRMRITLPRESTGPYAMAKAS